MPTSPTLPLVLCVDDDEAMLATVVRCLKRDPLDVRATRSASEALSWIATEEIAVLVSDYDMPEMTGAQLAAHARSMRPETVHVLLTGKRALETAVDGINHGEIFRFLNKPFQNEQLREVVRSAVVRHHELLAMAIDRERRERREVLRTALEETYPGISAVARKASELHVVTDEPWAEAAVLGLVGFTIALEPTS